MSVENEQGGAVQASLPPAEKITTAAAAGVTRGVADSATDSENLPSPVLARANALMKRYHVQHDSAAVQGDGEWPILTDTLGTGETENTTASASGKTTTAPMMPIAEEIVEHTMPEAMAYFHRAAEGDEIVEVGSEIGSDAGNDADDEVLVRFISKRLETEIPKLVRKILAEWRHSQQTVAVWSPLAGTEPPPATHLPPRGES